MADGTRDSQRGSGGQSLPARRLVPRGHHLIPEVPYAPRRADPKQNLTIAAYRNIWARLSLPWETYWPGISMSNSRCIVAIVRETLTGYHVAVWVRWPDSRHVLASMEFDSLTGAERFVHQCAREIGVPKKQVDIFRRRADGGPLHQPEQAKSRHVSAPALSPSARGHPRFASRGHFGQ
jgi:hypothetical protein